MLFNLQDHCLSILTLGVLRRHIRPLLGGGAGVVLSAVGVRDHGSRGGQQVGIGELVCLGGEGRACACSAIGWVGDGGWVSMLCGMCQHASCHDT